MISVSHHYHPVSDKVPPEFRPLMAAFSSYFLQTNESDQHNARMVKAVEAMIWKLAAFVDSENDIGFNPYNRFMKDVPRRKIRDFLLKKDGTIMTSMEQFEVFAKLVNAKGYCADVYMFQQGWQHYLWKTNEYQFSPYIIPVVRLLDGRFAAVSVYNCFAFDLKKRLLRTETQKQRKERRIHRYLAKKKAIQSFVDQKIHRFLTKN